MLTQLYKSYNSSGYFTNINDGIVNLAAPHIFEPTVDYSMLDHMKERCLHSNDYRHYSSEYMDQQQTLCTRILSMQFNEKIGPDSYTDHHWTHLWAGEKYDPWAVSNWRIFFNVSTLMHNWLYLYDDVLLNLVIYLWSPAELWILNNVGIKQVSWICYLYLKYNSRTHCQLIQMSEAIIQFLPLYYYLVMSRICHGLCDVYF